MWPWDLVPFLKTLFVNFFPSCCMGGTASELSRVAWLVPPLTHSDGGLTRWCVYVMLCWWSLSVTRSHVFLARGRFKHLRLWQVASEVCLFFLTHPAHPVVKGWRCDACFEFTCLFKKMRARTCFHIFYVMSLFTSRFSSLAQKSQRQKSQWKNVSIALQGLPQRNFAPIHSVKSGTLQNALFYKSENGCRFGEKCSYAHARLMISLAKGLKRMVTKVQWLCWKVHDNRVAYFKIWSSRSLHRFCVRAQSNIRKPIRRVQFTKAVVRHANTRDQNPSLGMICQVILISETPNAPKFEDRSQEETEWQERWARQAAWRLAKRIVKLKMKNKTAFLPTFGKLVPACAINS